MGEDSWRTVSVPAARLDDLVTDIRHPLAIKIDVQGAEPFVVEGATETLAAADIAIFEFAPYWLAQVGGDPSVITGCLAAFDKVRVADHEDGSVGPPEPIDEVAERLLRAAETQKHNPGWYVDVIAHRGGALDAYRTTSSEARRLADARPSSSPAASCSERESRDRAPRDPLP
jgi:hypothetical protein